MSIQWIARVLDLEHPDLDSGMKFILLGLANHTNPPNQCFPSVRLLMKYTAQCERAVRSNIRKLEDAGLVRIERRPQKTSLYFFAFGGGAESAPLGADDAPLGADSAPEPLLNHQITDASAKPDARAFEDWKVSELTTKRIEKDEGLCSAEIEREQRLFILKCLAGRIPTNPDAAFRVWCARVKTLNHKPKAPPAAALDPLQPRDRVATLALYRSMLKTYEDAEHHKYAEQMRIMIGKLEERNDVTEAGTGQQVQ